MRPLPRLAVPSPQSARSSSPVGSSAPASPSPVRWLPSVASFLKLCAFLAVALASAAPAAAQNQDYEYRYHTYAERQALLEAWVAAHPELARLESLGPSQTGTMDIWAVEITNQIGRAHV